MRNAFIILSLAPAISTSPDKAGSPLILYHELDGPGEIIRSIALDRAMFELISVLIAITVFTWIIRWVMGGDEQ